MTTKDENRQQLIAELLELSAKIDALVVESKKAPTDQVLDRGLEESRARQDEITKKLHLLEENIPDVWQNIGDGG